jgi:hypothetical protein
VAWCEWWLCGIERHYDVPGAEKLEPLFTHLIPARPDQAPNLFRAEEPGVIIDSEMDSSSRLHLPVHLVEVCSFLD